jgi:hypothetical protein
VRLEAGHGDLLNGVGLVGGLGGGDDGSIGYERKVDARVRYKVGLEFVEIYVEGTVESERSGDRRDDFEAVRIYLRAIRFKGAYPEQSNGSSFIVGALNVQVSAADVVDSLVVDHERTVRVLEGGVSRQDGVVRLNDSSRHLRSRVDGEIPTCTSCQSRRRDAP